MFVRLLLQLTTTGPLPGELVGGGGGGSGLVGRLLTLDARHAD